MSSFFNIYAMSFVIETFVFCFILSRNLWEGCLLIPASTRLSSALIGRLVFMAMASPVLCWRSSLFFLVLVDSRPVWTRLANENQGRRRVQPGVGRVCAVGELAATGWTGGAVLSRGGWFDTGLIHSSAESMHWWGAWWLELVWILLISTGVSGRCCRLRVFDCRRFKGLVRQLSLIFCATGQ